MLILSNIKWGREAVLCTVAKGGRGPEEPGEDVKAREAVL